MNNSRYTIRSVTNTKQQDGLSLYEARKALVAAAADGLINDGTRVTRWDCGRESLVAFYCQHRNDVRAGFGANEMERGLINDSWKKIA